MSSTAPTKAEAWRRERRIKAHKEEVARLREEIGDPQEALFRFVTERFEVQAVVPNDGLARGSGRAVWEDDDELDGW